MSGAEIGAVHEHDVRFVGADAPIDERRWEDAEATR